MSEVDYSNISFSIIRNRGSLNEAITHDGYKVKRREMVYVPEWETMVRCAPYSEHFVYLDPSGKEKRWFASCTCGSMAVITGYNAYKQDASKDNMPMLLCHYHATYGVHATGDKSWYTGI
ncbi:MAG: hypothetical protein H8D23_29790 [Candidatus Brocadiales bacterium]|nr:hypothetical protein [Candidatus Brocadiales bacterium]